MIYLLKISLSSLSFTIKDLILVCIFLLLYMLGIYCIMAFFNGWDNVEPKKSKLYLFCYSLGNKLYVAHQLKIMLEQGSHEKDNSDSSDS